MKSEFVLCIDDREAPDLERRKFYRVIKDAKARKHGMLRVIDESGEGYLYPDSCFVEVALTPTIEGRLRGKTRNSKRASG